MRFTTALISTIGAVRVSIAPLVVIEAVVVARELI